MSTKRFCDMCGDEIHATVKRMGADLTRKVPGLPFKINTNINFSVVEHPTGFGGPPDLCEPCTVTLVHEVADALAANTSKPKRKRAKKGAK